MKIRRANLFEKIVLFILVAFPIYQDSPLVSLMGAAGYSLMLPLSFVFFFIILLKKLSLPKSKSLLSLFKLGLYLCVISCLSIVFWLLSGNDVVVLDENIFVKAIKGLIQYFSYLAYISVLLILIRHLGEYLVGFYSFVVLLILTGICLIEKENLPYAFPWIHFSGTLPYHRIRLLTTESSWTAMMIFVYSSLACLWALKTRKRCSLVVSLMCLLVLIFTTGSKTLLVLTILSIIGFFFVSTRHLTKKKIGFLAVFCVTAIVVILVILPTLLESVAGDISNSTSIATRFYTIFIGFIIGLRHPLGVGCGAYIGIFQNYLRKYLSVFSLIPIKFNTSEIESLAYGATDTNLAVKSGLFHNHMYWGIVGTLILLSNYFLIIRKLRKDKSPDGLFLSVVFFLSIVLIAFAQSFSYEFWLMYAFTVGFLEKKNYKKVIRE